MLGWLWVEKSCLKPSVYIHMSRETLKRDRLYNYMQNSEWRRGLVGDENMINLYYISIPTGPNGLRLGTGYNPRILLSFSLSVY